jgi:hypothetical protein
MEDSKVDVLRVNENLEENWQLCCSVLHKAEVVFFVQIIFLFTIMVFSMVQIINKVDNQEIYFSLLSSCIGIIIPSPTITAKK